MISGNAIATASRGTEQSLIEELTEFGIGNIESFPGAVSFGSKLEDAYRACLFSRVASRILWPVTQFQARNADEFYDGVRTVNWLDHMGPKSTMAVMVAGSHAKAGPSNYLTRLTKDAVVDQIRDIKGARPSIDTERPDVRLHVHVAMDAVQVSIDLAGRGLHNRGFKRSGAVAPLKETLAAALLRMAGWNPKTAEQPLFDPMCGSGTFLFEAASIACQIAPGLTRGTFGAKRWFGHDIALWDRLLDEARALAEKGRRRVLRIAGADASARTVDVVRRRLDRAGWTRRVKVHVRDLRQIAPPWPTPGLVVINPPYGERLGHAAELGPLYQSLGDLLKQKFPGWTGWILSGNRQLDRKVGLRPTAREQVFNGPIECRWLSYPIEARKIDEGEELRGPAWRKASEATQPFIKKLKKNFVERSVWAKKNDISAFRIYDSAIPEFNFSIDWYDGAVRVEEYAAPKKIPDRIADHRLQDAMRAIPDALKVSEKAMTLRVRRKRDADSQIEKFDDRAQFKFVKEGPFKFRVNLTDYLDTGLFLDDREIRRRIYRNAKGTNFLNLFAYTCSASVAAAMGGAHTTTSIDLSNAYLDWGRKNFEANDIRITDHHRFVKDDVLAGLKQSGEHRFDLILVAPPSFSRSKSMDGSFDIMRDHGWMLSQIARRRLSRKGKIIFSTNLRKFELDEEHIQTAGLQAVNITEEMTPRDFERRPRLKVWELSMKPRDW